MLDNVMFSSIIFPAFRVLCGENAISQETKMMLLNVKDVSYSSQQSLQL